MANFWYQYSGIIIFAVVIIAAVLMMTTKRKPNRPMFENALLRDLTGGQ